MQPLPREGFRSRTRAEVPTRLTQGAFVEIVCRVENTGDHTFSSAFPNPVHVAARWLLPDGVAAPEPIHVPLPGVLRAGDAIRLRLPVEVPELVGTHRLRIAPVQELVAWFDDVRPENGIEVEVEVSSPDPGADGLHELVQRFPPPTIPWVVGYAERHRALVSAALDDRELLDRVRAGGELPRRYGLGFDERVVEYPWLFVQELRPPILDVGSTLNHAHILDRLGPLARELTILTLAPEPDAFTGRGVTYVYDDARSAPFPDGAFRSIVCLSTLEHVGMDNSRFGAAPGASDDPLAERERAVAELRRLVAPGGAIYLSVPFGVARDFGWVLPFDQEALDRLRDLLRPRDWDVRIYAHTADGWQPTEAALAAGAQFEDHAAGPHAVPDKAAAARAVACVRALV
jgi:SAM-dependent methyltransferase